MELVYSIHKLEVDNIHYNIKRKEGEREQDSGETEREHE